MRTLNTDINAAEEKAARRAYNRSHIDCHVVCAVITLAFLALGVFEFFGSVGRIIEAGRDFGLSVAYYFCQICGLSHNITPTVNEFPKIPFFDFMGGAEAPAVPVPEDWQGFTENWSAYWQLWASGENFLSYLSLLGRLLLILSQSLLIIVPVVLLVYMLFRRLLKNYNNDYGKDSIPLRVFKRISSVTYRPAKAWLLRFCCFVRENGVYGKR